MARMQAWGGALRAQEIGDRSWKIGAALRAPMAEVGGLGRCRVRPRARLNETRPACGRIIFDLAREGACQCARGLRLVAYGSESGRAPRDRRRLRRLRFGTAGPAFPTFWNEGRCRAIPGGDDRPRSSGETGNSRPAQEFRSVVLRAKADTRAACPYRRCRARGAAAPIENLG